MARARKIQRFLSQPFDVAKVFTGSDGVQVPLEETIASFKAVVAGEYDHLPEGAFYMVGGIEDVKAKAEKHGVRRRLMTADRGERSGSRLTQGGHAWLTRCNSTWFARAPADVGAGVASVQIPGAEGD